MKPTTFLAWAIDTRSGEGHNLLGRYWNFDNSHRNIPPHLEGCQDALFKTRKLAREAVALQKKHDYHPFPKMRPVHVKVTIEELPHDNK